MIGMTTSVLVRPLLLGLVTGMRSQLGLAVLAWSEPGPWNPAPVRALRSRSGRAAVGLAAAGEIVADKLPSTPSRLNPPVLGARLAAGALVGTLAADTASRRSLLLAGATGMAGAAAGTYAGAAYRKAAVARTSTPDLPWALVEDAVAATLAATAVKVRPERRAWWRRLPLAGR
jgi:uncharacterized membrane protein